MVRNKKYIVKPGDRFGRLVVLQENKTYHLSQPSAKTSKFYDVQCDCGNIATVKKHNLTNGNTKSCGCLRAELSSQRLKERHRKAKQQPADNTK